MNFKHVAASVCALLASFYVAAQPQPKDGSCRSVTAETCAIANDMGRGVNLGEMLDTPKEGAWGFRLEPDFIEKSASMFRTVRLPVRFSSRAAVTRDATMDEFFLERVDGIVDSLLAKGVYVILDFHGYNQLTGGNVQAPLEAAVDPEVVDERFINIWAQLAKRYADRSPKLVFELYNEPSGRLEGGKWNALAARALEVIRKTNPARAVMFGPAHGNHSKGLPALVMVADRNIIVPIHNYDPFNFTHQGVTWNPYFSKTGIACCDAAQRKMVTDALDQAKEWSLRNGYPVTIGEFGTYAKGEMAYRAAYTRFFRDETEKRGFSWTYWNFVGSFGVYSPKDRTWVEPIRAALLD